MVHSVDLPLKDATMIRRAYAQTPSGQIHYYEGGRGRPVLMLHETPRSGWSYAPLIERLAPRFRCLAPDTLGFGMSDPLPAGAKMEDLAQSMFELMDGLGIETIDLIGFHTGNKIAAAMAAMRPERVGKAILIGMTHSLVVSRKARNAAIMTVVRRHMGHYVEHDDGADLLRTWGADFGAIASTWFNPAVTNATEIDAARLRGQEARTIEAIQCRHTIRPIYQMNFDFDFTATLKRVKAPTLVIECKVPEEAHLGAQGPAMLELLDQGELLTLEHAGFDATESHADRIARSSAAFLRRSR